MRRFISLLLLIVGIAAPYSYSQAPTRNANSYVRPYGEAFQYGINLGYYGNGWDDEGLATAAQTLGVRSVRPTLPDYFVEKYGFGIRANTFKVYTDELGMKEITCFIGEPSAAHLDKTTYLGSSGPSKVFANLYEPIWTSNGSVNPNNYYAYYMYQLLQTYGDKVRFWEIVNEPDYTFIGNKDVWLSRAPSPAELPNLRAPFYYYIRMLRISYEVVKKYRPDAYVTTGGIGYPQFLDALLRYSDNPNGGSITAQYPNTGGAYLDAVSFHTYPAYSLHKWDNSIGGFRYFRTSDYAAERVIQEEQAMVDVLNRYGYNGTKYPAKHIIMTETNVSRRTSDDRISTDEMQRNFGIKMLVQAQKNRIRQLYFYHLGESINTPAASISVSRGDALDLMGFYENLKRDAPGQQRTTQLGQGFATTSKLLYGFSYDAARTAALTLPANANGAAFRKDNSYVYVLWAKALTDKSEYAKVTYSFPAALGLKTVKRYEWNFSSTNASSIQQAQEITLSGTPAFFVEDAASQVVAPAPPVASSGCDNTGTLLREQWNNVKGATTADIPVTKLPNSSSQLTSFAASNQYGNNHGARLRGYICPPQNGAYTFWVTGDDAADLFLSSDDDPAHKVRIASSTGWRASAYDWYRSSEQKSAPIQLQTGRRYYVEVLHKQSWGTGFVAVAWQRPDGSRQQPISGSVLIPFVPVTSSQLTATATVASATLNDTIDNSAPATNLNIYPNPFSKQATVQFSVQQRSQVTLALYNLTGQQIRSLFDGQVEAGVQNSVSMESVGLSNGLYIVRLVTGTEVVSQKVSYAGE
ncbi:PA14 domain-containing protein [Hymenobacter profundi]|uniref:T9SS type A sorting domain-containing protein n=1 Tax=Hymenobacter profundi TaxID=1982110 RepID=A0ABS6WX73_9BACT|nr:PA14 domain-containing protein [Hymenobacter profundi]MBW3127676.1 T9SS type A sorting domain-containing protein [Hymenobacter profundi]